jgi:hypothetical protein
MDGGLPVTMDTLFGHVKLGMTHWATLEKPELMKRAMVGIAPSRNAASM